MDIRSAKPGFTLIELLLVIGIIVILAAIVIVSMFPSKQLAEERNNVRTSHVHAILNAVYQYSIANNNQLPASIPTTATEICQGEPGIDCTGLVDLGVLMGSYIATIPADPVAATVTSTKYTVVKNAVNNSITVAAPNAENGEIIAATR